jgi:hypothetical protein
MSVLPAMCRARDVFIYVHAVAVPALNRRGWSTWARYVAPVLENISGPARMDLWSDAATALEK